MAINKFDNNKMSSKWQYWFESWRSSAINAYVLMLIVAVFLLLTSNVSFFGQVIKVYALASHVGFFVSIISVLFGVLLLLCVLLSYRFTIKVVLITLVIIAAVTSYFTDTYGTVYDTTMLQNALQTDGAETKDLLNGVFILRLLILGILPSLLIATKPIYFPPLKSSLIQRAMVWLLSLGCIGLPMAAFGKQYASFFREHKAVRFYTNPVTPIYAFGKLASITYQKSTAPKEMIAHASDAKVNPTMGQKPRLVVMVVGETARSDHVSMNGYHRDTFPRLSKLLGTGGLQNFSQVTACGTSTAYSVPCMFSYLGAKDYDVDTASYHENVMDTLHRLGIAVLWRDNNSDSKGVMNRLPTEQYANYKEAPTNTLCNTNPYQECRDQGMLVGLDDYVKSKAGKDILIVLHQMGNHGPAYYKRYDEKFAKFTPVCQSNELAKCDVQSVINAYDNALLATDDFLANTIDWLKTHENDRQVAMLYVSDHGESLGEKGVYLHGMPNAFAPIEQKQVAAVFWSSPSDTLIKAVDSNTPLSHDAITPTLLSLFGVTTSATTDKDKFIQ